jgi:hypothetical protein
MVYVEYQIQISPFASVLFPPGILFKLKQAVGNQATWCALSCLKFILLYILGWVSFVINYY